jgi:hypothetical protein
VGLPLIASVTPLASPVIHSVAPSRDGIGVPILIGMFLSSMITIDMIYWLVGGIVECRLGHSTIGP